jgi:hypothetical protein
VTPEDVAERYRRLGLTVHRFNDPPGYLYRFHEHPLTRLFTVAGAGLMKVGSGNEVTYRLALPGDELMIESSVLHRGVAGPEGWEYIAGHQA